MLKRYTIQSILHIVSVKTLHFRIKTGTSLVKIKQSTGIDQMMYSYQIKK